MLLRLSVVLALLVSGATAQVPPAAPATPAAAPAAAPTAEGDGGAAVPLDDGYAELDVVVPAVTAAGEVEPSGDVAAAGDVVTDVAAGGSRVATDVLETEEFQTLGVTWPLEVDGETLAPQVRTRVDGEWSDWVALEADDSAPDAGTPDAERAVRGGTDALWVGAADAVQLSVVSSAEGGPEGVTLALLGEGDEPAPALRAPAATSSATSQEAVVAPAALVTAGAPASVAPAAVRTAPPAQIFTRAQWGARAPSCAPDVASKLVGAVVHHTAGSNAYGSTAEAAAQIRNDQRYHMDSRGWCDLGYNFIVDKWGNIYEGRVNSITQPVIGVHAGGFNTGTMGVSMLGTYSSPPSPAVQQAVGVLIGWRLSAYNIDPQGSMVYRTGNGDNSRYQNQDVSLPRIFGHRDVSYTACPGEGGYSVLPTIRAVAGSNFDTAVLTQSQSVVKALYQDLLGRTPDSGGLYGWATALASGTSQTSLVNSLTSSDEYVNQRVAKAYREVLGREPEAAGIRAWHDEIMAERLTVDDVQRRFYDSDEFFARSGGTPEGYVDMLYRTMFQRPATAQEAAAWSEQIRQVGRGRVVDGIWFSFEAAMYRAGNYYRTFLARNPDVAGQQSWAQVLIVQGEGAVRIGIAGSVEYRNRALVRFP